MTAEQLDKTAGPKDAVPHPAPDHRVAAQQSVEDQRSAAQKEKARIDQTAGQHLQPVKIDGQEKLRTAAEAPAPAAAPAKPVDDKAMEQTADAIRKATGNDNYVARWADKDAINNLLKDKSESERAAIEKIYEKKHHVTLDKEMGFLSGADRDKFENILHKKDGNVDSQDVGRVHAALLEHQNVFMGRSSEVLDKDIRDSLSGKRADEIKKMDDEYQAKYHCSLHDAIKNDPKVSQETKDMVDVYLKGVDKRTDDDTLKLAHATLGAKDEKAFEDVMKNASESARTTFKNQNGEKQIKDAFGAEQGWGTLAMSTLLPGYGVKAALDQSHADKAVQHALDVAKEGKIDAATQIADNTGVIKWTTNDKAVDTAISGMTDDERSRYIAGKKLATGDNAAGHDLNEQQKQDAKDYYEKMHTAMTSAGSDTAVAKWEDEIQHKGGSLVSKLAAHGGTFWNDGSGDIAHEIENMDKSDWERMKPGSATYDPEYRKQIESMLHSYKCNDETLKRCNDILDAKQKAGTFEQAESTAHSSLLDNLDDNKHWYKDDSHSMLESISKMTPAEQELYRTDINYRKQVDTKVNDALGASSDAGSERPELLQSAQDMLAKVAQGEKLNYDIVANLEGYGTDFNTDHKKAIGDIETALKDDKLRARINNPQSPEDKAYAAKFESAARNALGDSDYEKYVTPIVKDGHLDIATKLQLDKGIFKNDHEGALKDITTASPEELKRLKDDPAFREKAIGFLGAEDKKVAQNVIDQGRVNPEDEVRQNIEHWGGSSDIMDKLRSVKDNQVQLDQMKADYSRKYGSDMEADLIGKLSGDNKLEAIRILHDHETTEEKYNDSRDQYYKSRDGFGSNFVEYVGQSGTGYQLDDAMGNYQKEVADAHKNFSEVTPAQQKQLEEHFQDTLKNFKESKAATADAIVNGAVAGAAIASLIVTGGADAPLLLAMAAGGAAMKVGAKAAIMGGDYDTDAYSVTMDCAAGAVNGVTSVLGPGECAALFKVGETAAMEAAAATTQQLAEKGVATLIQEGGEETLQKGTADIMRHALSSGAKEVDPKAIAALADRVLTPELTGAAREQAVREVSQTLSKNLQTHLEQETATWLTSVGREAALNAGGGALGGGAAGVFDGASQWDPKKSVGENLETIAKASSMSALTGGAMGGGMTIGMKAIGHGIAGSQNVFRTSEPAINMVHLPEGQAHLTPPTTAEVLKPASEVGAAVSIAEAAKPVTAISSPGERAQYGPLEPAPAAGPRNFPLERTPFNGGQTLIHTPKTFEPPAAAGDRVLYNGEKYKMGGMEPSGKYAILHTEGDLPNPVSKRVSNKEFYSQYEHIKRNTPTAQDAYYVRDKSGSVFAANTEANGDIHLESVPQFKAVPTGEVKLPPVNGPEDVVFAINGKSAHLENGSFDLGATVADQGGNVQLKNASVSGNHGRVTWDRNEEKFFYQDLNSTNGSEIKVAGSNQWETVPRGRKVEFKQGDEIRLARQNETILHMSGKPLKEFPNPDDVQIYVDNKPVQMRDNQLAIGRAERADGKDVMADRSVSNNHGALRYDASEGAFYYRDTNSTNGTYLKREGSNEFVRLRPNQEVRVGTSDEIHLGRVDGPALNLVPFEETHVRPVTQSKDLAVTLDGQNIDLKNGPVELGRNYPLGESQTRIADTRVSREHGSVRWDENQKSLMYRDHSSAGTYIKREGNTSWEKVSNKETRIGVNDEIHLGSPDGPSLKLADARTNSVMQDNQAFFGGAPLDMSSGSVEIGRGHQAFSNSENDALNQLVSNDHGTLKWNNKENAFYYTDHSSNGSYIKRAGSDKFVRLPSDSPVQIGKYDQLRLGGEAGPELKLTQDRGQMLDDGRVRFKRPDGNLIRNADGSEIFSDGAGIKLERSPRGQILNASDPAGFQTDYIYDSKGQLNRVDFSNGSNWQRLDDNRWEINHPNGSRNIERTQISVEHDGGLRFKGADGDTIHNVDGSTELIKPNGRIEYQAARLDFEQHRLNALSDRNFTNIDQKKRFNDIVHDFQTRARQAGLSNNEIALTYHQVNRLMLAGADAPLTLGERMRLSEQIMHESAYPTQIDQGRNPTCNVATIENRIFTRQPDKAARLIVDVATTGKYITADGTLIDLTRVPGGLRPDTEALGGMANSFNRGSLGDIKVDGQRNWAGQIFEQTAANVKWARTPELHMQPGDVLMYTKPEGKESAQLMRYSPDKSGRMQVTRIDDSPNIYSPELTDIHNQITGGNDRDFVIVGPQRNEGLAGQARRVNSAAEFERALIDLKNKKDFPAVVLVDARNEPFKKWINSDGHTSAWHVVNVQNISVDARTGRMMVEVSNQWGEKANHLGARAIDADELFRSTIPVDGQKVRGYAGSSDDAAAASQADDPAQ